MQRAFIIVLDSFGIGASKDANRFGDEGANTLGHIAEFCHQSAAIQEREGELNLPNLTRLGLGKAAEQSSGRFPPGLDIQAKIIGAYAYASTISFGKDTLSGHWEIAGVPVLFDWDYFPSQKNTFPPELLSALISHANLPGFLGNCHASGSLILDRLGEEHMRTGKPIFYTSADSVFQIACHEETFLLKRLYSLCQIAREILIEGGYNIGRVIARPFIGEKQGNFIRTGNRRDLIISLPSVTVLQKLVEEKGGTVVSIGKTSDIYDKVAISKKVKASGLDALFDATIEEINSAGQNTLIFTNFINFDSDYGHRRDVSGYANALELFDRRLPELMSQLTGNDIMILTADHGCDPTWKGTDHTREHVPILIYGDKILPGFYGHRSTFADIGQTVSRYFSLSPMEYGTAIF
ncbi:phosphopentomutase [secondary endosymbiont of Heteropsylla cubana]|uniref:Phosphopentomutase n=1 Tax=secondary endosymbiont of Heteropsylla cubana TaxID=134287 RepID=J3TGC7_9ENTR|nr:phosphopentomutase [secondary endosymbiont of Heteropsylla cubana]AFP85457.1 phosphopentomutase [secondary endosymbiont of Heteropsylla cubana]